MKKKGKTAGKVVAALMLLLTVAVFVFNGYFEGETKAAEKLFDALERKDQTAFDKYTETSKNVLDVRRAVIEKSGILKMAETASQIAENSDNTPVSVDDTDIDFKVEFPSGATINPGGDRYVLPIKLTIYNDYNHVVLSKSDVHLKFINGRWRVSEINLA